MWDVLPIESRAREPGQDSGWHGGLHYVDLFSDPVRRWFAGNFERPTPVQVRGWPVIAAGRHALLVAPTGSGKTLAAFLWALDTLFRLPEDAPCRPTAGSPSSAFGMSSATGRCAS